MNRAGAHDTKAEWTERGQWIKGRMLLSTIVGRQVKLVRAGNEYDGLCPFHNDRNLGSFKVNDAKGIYHCFSCGADGDLIKFLMETNGWKYSEAVLELEKELGGGAKVALSDPKKRAEWEAEQARRDAADAAERQHRARRARAMWLGAEPIVKAGRDGATIASPALAYLRGRGIDFDQLGKVPGALRWRPDIGHIDFKGQADNRHAAMIACIRLLDGSIAGCHRTYLDVSGWDHRTRSGPVRKLGGVSDAKLSFGPSLGGHIPLWKGKSDKPLRDIPPGTDVYMSEGIEDGLSVAISVPDRRVIAGVSGSKLPSVELPPQMGRLILIGQRDKVTGACDEGFEAAVAAHQERGRTVDVMWPPEGYKDFNDVLTGKRIGAGQDGGTGCANGQ